MARWLSFVLVGVVCACADPLAPAPRPSPSRHVDALGTADGPVRVEIKFREARLVRRVNQEFRDGRGRRLNRVDGVLARRSAGEPRLLFARAAAEATRLGERAAARGRRAPALDAWYRVDVADSATAAELASELRDVPDVEAAYVAPEPQPLPGAAGGAWDAASSAATPNLRGAQGYFGTSAFGTAVDEVRALPGGDGRGVQLVDLEYAWNYAHEDLLMPPAEHHLGGTPYFGFGDDHGTAVLGILGARDNLFGVTGAAPRADVRTVAPFFDGRYEPAAGILFAAARMGRGDVLLLEQQAAGPHGGSAYVPLEWIPSVYDAIRTATAAGVIVVEAAGNGNVNLDGPALRERFNPAAYHSGAILVGAGTEDRARLPFSSYGVRVDLQAWGRNVTTTGYGGLFGTAVDRNRWYTGTFSGTSSASAVVAAAVTSLQGYHKAVTGEALDAARMTALLRQHGRPQTGALGSPIGPAVDLQPVVAAVAPAAAVMDVQPARLSLAATPAINVIVFSRPGFDARAIDPATARLVIDAGQGVAPATRGTSYVTSVRDVDADGRPDRMLTFRTADLVAAGLRPGDTALLLRGAAAAGRWAATDAVPAVVVP